MWHSLPSWPHCTHWPSAFFISAWQKRKLPTTQKGGETPHVFQVLDNVLPRNCGKAGRAPLQQLSQTNSLPAPTAELEEPQFNVKNLVAEGNAISVVVHDAQRTPLGLTQVAHLGREGQFCREQGGRTPTQRRPIRSSDLAVPNRCLTNYRFGWSGTQSLQ